MNAPERFEQDLPRLLAQLAEGARPDYRDSLVEATARTPQRPAWTFPGRWLPMDITARRPSVATVPIRPLALLLLVGLLLAAALAVVVGSQRGLPAPFGLADNGILVYAADGDIWASDLDGSNARVIVSGDVDSHWPTMSRQGTRFTFIRPAGPNGAADALYVANVDGTGVRALTGPLVAPKAAAWSPDGATIAVAHEEGGYSVIDLVASDGSGIRRIEAGMPIDSPAWRPGDGGQLLVRGRAGGSWALYLLAADDTQLSRLALPHEGIDGGLYDLVEPDWSPDGTRLVYQTLEALPFTDDPGWRIHVADVDPAGSVSDVTRLEFDPLADDEFSARWLPTGDRIAFVRFKGCTDSVIVAAPSPGADEMSARVEDSSCEYKDRGLGYEIAPDGGSVLTWPTAGAAIGVEAYPVAPGAVLPDTFAAAHVTWQRLAR